MNPELPNNPREELELRIIALLLGELSAAEAAAVREAIAQDAELTKLHDDLKQTIVLVREASCMKESAAPQAEPLKLSEQRRQKLLTAFKIPPLKEKDRKPRRSMGLRLIEVFAVLCILGILTSMLIPNFVKSRTTSQANAIINNLRQLDGAKQQWALENKKPADAEPTFGDVQPYLGRGASDLPSPVAGEEYVLGKVGESPSAVIDGDRSRSWFWGSKGKDESGRRITLPGAGNLAVADKNSDGIDVASVAGENQSSKPAASRDGRFGYYAVDHSVQPSAAPPVARPAPTSPQGGSSVDFANSSALGIKPSAPTISAQMPSRIELPALATVEPNTTSGIDLQSRLQSEVRQGIVNRPSAGGGGRSGGVGGSQMGEPVPVLGDLPIVGKQFKSEGRGDAGLQDGLNDLAKSPSKGAVALPVNAPSAVALDESIRTAPASELVSVLGSPVPQDSSQVLAFGLIEPATGLPVTKGKDSDVYDLNVEGYTVAPIPGQPSAPATATVPVRSARASTKTPTDNLALGENSSGQLGDRFYRVNAPTSSATTDKSNVNAQDAEGRERFANSGGIGGDDLRANLQEQQPSTDTKTRAYLDQKQKVEVLRKQVASGFETAGNSGNLPNESDLYRTYEKQALEYRARYGALTNQLRKSDGLNSSTKELETQIKIAKTELDSVNQLLDDSKSADNARSEETRPYFEAKKKLEELNRALDEAQSDPAPPRTPSTNAPTPQPEIQTGENNFSTFSLNVSDVSFKLAAASLEKGQMPDATSVRSEEFINAFDYRDPEPQGSAPIAFAWERARYSFAHNRDLLRFSLKTAAAGRQAGRPLNIVLLLDNSGSMERADRVRIIREALRVLASQLLPQDKLSVITFARTARLVADGISGDKAAEVADQVSGLTPEGGTNLEDAMNLAYQTAARHYSASGINRVVLLTDGAANLGDVEPASLKLKVEAQRKQGIALDCFGIGWEGFNDDLLEVLSRNGDGRYGFINSPEEAATDFVGQLAGALQVAASDVKVQVEFNPKRVTSYRQVGYAKHQLTKEQFRDNTVDAAEIAAQEAGNALYTVEANPAGAGPLATVRVRYKVPGTADYREQSWDVPFTGNALSLEQSSPAMRLAASASAFSEWLVASPFAGEVKPDALLGYLRGVPEVYGADARPKKLEWMIRQAKSVAGK